MGDMGDVSVNRVHEFVKTFFRVHHNKNVEEQCVRVFNWQSSVSGSKVMVQSYIFTNCKKWLL